MQVSGHLHVTNVRTPTPTGGTPEPVWNVHEERKS